MKNKEFFKDKLLEITSYPTAVNKYSGKVGDCIDIACDNCLFYGKENKCLFMCKKWLNEEPIEPILSDAEKRYLENVLRPFQDRVKFITKNRTNMHHEYLSMVVMTHHNNDKMTTYMEFPYFERETMYIGMEPNKVYTIEELGLFGKSKAAK